MTVLGLTGFSQSGKDTAASFLVEHGFKRLAFADILRQSLYNLNPYVVLEERFDHVDGVLRKLELVRVQKLIDKIGWDSAKVVYSEIRALLQRFGTEVGRDLYGEQFWVEQVISQIENDRKVKPRGHETAWSNFVITDVRFPNECDAVQRLGGKVYKIVRPGIGAVNSHVSDTGVDSLDVDGVVLNEGSLENFRKLILSLVGL